jgi:hypothetical protein
LHQPNWLGARLPFDSVENAINPNAGILKILKQISDHNPFTINADQTKIHCSLNQNTLVGFGGYSFSKHLRSHSVEMQRRGIGKKMRGQKNRKRNKDKA